MGILDATAPGYAEAYTSPLKRSSIGIAAFVGQTTVLMSSPILRRIMRHDWPYLSILMAQLGGQ